LGVLELCLEGLSPPNPPRGEGTEAKVDIWVGSLFLCIANEYCWRCWGIFCSFKLRSSGLLYFAVHCVQLCCLRCWLVCMYGKD